MQTFCGYIAFLGRPNAGKSTLLNACVGQKIVGVSKRPQTTRNRILGLDTQGPYQFVYLDTPGIHKAEGQSKMNQVMNKAAWSVLAEADIVCYLVDAAKGWLPADTQYFSGILQKTTVPILVLASKVDTAKKQEINQGLASIEAGMQECLASTQREASATEPQILVISAKRKETLEALRDKFKSLLPENPWLFDPEDLSDRPEKFLVAELIREQLFRQLGQELPYGTTVVVEELEREQGKVAILATIITNKNSHKPIIIGKQGSGLKRIGTEARLSLEKHFGEKVYLELFVKVVEKWTEDPQLIFQFQDIEP